MRNLTILLLIILFTGHVFAQKENKIWYFGAEAGLDFNFDPPQVLTDSKLGAAEGCGVVCDTGGKLMFYTNGSYIMNRNHEIMLNSTLFSNTSASQNGVVASHPTNPTLCYVFTNGAQEGGGKSGFRYSIVDMSLEGGLGDVSSGNNILLEKSSEKVAVAEHANNVDKWAVTHDYDSSKIVAFPITENGVGDSVVSELGFEFNLAHTWNRAGYMVFSSDYSKLAMVLYFTGLIVIYDFDNSTGLVSNPIVIESDEGDYAYSYGIAFSPDDTKLYTTKRGRSPSRIYQFDISSNSLDNIIASRVTIDENVILDYFCALMLGPDKKLYVASHKHGYLHRIDNPNAAGTACGYVENAVYLEGRESRKGLPTRAIAVASTDTSNGGPDDTTTTDGLNPILSIECNDTSCFVPGTKVSIPYELTISDEILTSGDLGGIMRAVLRFDRFLLDPDDSKIVSATEIGEEYEIVIHDNINNHTNYKIKNSIGFYTGLGKRSSTPITVTDLSINGIEYFIDTLEISNGCACIKVCNEGGARLVNPEGQQIALTVLPNPAGDRITVELSLIEKGRTSLYLVDNLGRKASVLLDEENSRYGKSRRSFSTEGLNSGIYNIILQTPSLRISKLLMIVK